MRRQFTAYQMDTANDDAQCAGGGFGIGPEEPAEGVETPAAAAKPPRKRRPKKSTKTGKTRKAAKAKKGGSTRKAGAAKRSKRKVSRKK